MASELYVSAQIEQHGESSTYIPTPPTSGLPTGRCMFIKLRQPVANQRCSCETYQQKQTVPGAYCNCGHQASYHLYAQCYEDVASEHITSPSPVFKEPPPPQPPIDQIRTLEQRIQTLETRYSLGAAHWHQRLLQEQHAHQETLKQLQQHISVFTQFMKSMQQVDMQRRFGEVEDRLDQVMDCQQRLFDKVVSVEDFGMMLEDRILEVEGLSEKELGVVPGTDQNGKYDLGKGSCGCHLMGMEREVRSDDQIEAVGLDYKIARTE